MRVPGQEPRSRPAHWHRRRALASRAQREQSRRKFLKPSEQATLATFDELARRSRAADDSCATGPARSSPSVAVR